MRWVGGWARSVLFFMYYVANVCISLRLLCCFFVAGCLKYHMGSKQ